MLRVRMPIARLVSAGEVFGGPGSLAVLRAIGAARACLVVAGEAAERPDYLATLERAIGALERRTLVAPAGEPTTAAVEALAAHVQEARPDWIVAVGGGSVLDAARAAWVRYENSATPLDAFARPFSLPPLRGLARFAAVPVTFGTGAEVSSAIVVSDDATKRKRVIVSHELLPDLVVLDPTVTVNVPARALAASMLDALAHVLEGAVSLVRNPLVDVLGGQALGTLLAELALGVPAPDDAARRFRLQVAAMQGGWVQNHRPPGLGHAVAHALGTLGVPHGVATGLCLAPAMRINARTAAVASAYDDVARSVGLAGWQALADCAASLQAGLGFAARLSVFDAGAAARLAAATQDVGALACADITARTNPTPVTPELAAELIEAIA